MIGGRQLSLGDYGTILRRRLWLILIPVVLGPALAFLIAKRLSPRYTSSSLILIEEPKVPTSVVPSVLGNDLTARVAHITEQIESRTLLEPVIEQYGLYKQDLKKVSMEDLVEKMRADILVRPVQFSKQPGESSAASANQVPGFQLSFTADTPALAQSVCAWITSQFINQNLKLGEARAVGTSQFLSGELQNAKQQLDAEDAKLAAFKLKYFGSLPDQEQSTIQLLASLGRELNSVNDTLSRDREDKTYLETLLAQELQSWKTTQTGASPQTLQQQLVKLQTNLAALRMQYTDTYPDVIKAKQAISELEKKIAQQDTGTKTHAPSKAAVAPAASTQVNQLRAQIGSLDIAIQTAERNQENLRQQIQAYTAKLKMTPAVEQQYKDITRNYQTALKFYDSLLAKEDLSQMSTNLEMQQGGQNFEVLDPADLPRKPSFPNYGRFAAGGALLGIVLGLGLALAIEMRDKALRDEKDVEFFLGAPVLALVPFIPNGHKKTEGTSKKASDQATELVAGPSQR
jgi:polysaccharide chain length determinant protein (PEP-CTERM system associated)